MLPATGTLLQWVNEYGYPVLGGLMLAAAAGVPIPIEIVLVALGALSASSGGPSFVALAVVGIAATVAGDALDYAVGRLFGHTVIERLTRGKRQAHQSSATMEGSTQPLAWVQWLATWSGSGMMIVLSRCALTPLEMPISLLAGASRRPFYTFLLWDVLGEALYVVGYLMLGHAGGTLASSGPLLLAFGALGLLLGGAPLLLTHWLSGNFRRLPASTLEKGSERSGERRQAGDARYENDGMAREHVVAGSDHVGRERLWRTVPQR